MTSWTDAAVEHLTTRWREGISASQIAREINAAHRSTFTRNSVIGKLHRLGLCGRQAAKPCVPRRVQYTRKRVLAASPPKPAGKQPKKPERDIPDAPAPLNIPLPALRPDHCRAIVSGTGADAFYCGHAKQSGSSYCAHHHARYTTGVVWSATRGRIISERAR